ncbi:Chromosome partition protein Smc [Thauera mechernichensis]|jgi:chromosome segregation ATPase|nr:DNA-binding protein [Thauera sp.]
MAITKQDILAVADALDAEGVKPTLAAVRKKLGGGSFSTISEAMKEWKADHASAAAPLREPAPPAVVERSADLAAELWAACMELANARLAGEREALEVAREEMEASQREAAELADQMAGDIEALQAQVSSLQVRAESAESEIDDMRAELAAALERAGRAEARAAEIEKRADDAKTELGRMHELLSEERKQHAAELERQTVALQAAQEAARAQGEEIAALRAQVVSVHSERDQARAEASGLRTELATLTARAAAESEQHQEQRKRAAEEAHRCAEKLTKATADRDEARTEAAHLRGQLEALAGRKKEGG